MPWYAGSDTAGVLTLNGASGAVTLAVVGGSIDTVGSTITITITPGVTSWADLSGKPSTFPPSVHGHIVADVTGLQAALDGKQAAGSYVLTTDSRLSDAREWSASTVTQAVAEAGTDTARVAWTVQRVWQAIAAWWAASSAKAKLDGIATGATANSSDATLLARANHTGTQAVGTITGLGTLATQSGTFSGTSSGTNTGDQTITLSGDVTGSGTGSFAATLSASGVTAGTYASVTVDAKGRVTAGTVTQEWSTITSTPTTRAGYGITDAQKSITVSSAAPSGGSSGDLYVQTSAAGQVTPATLTADANDYAPSAGDIYRLSADAARNLTGWTAWNDGTVKLLVNVGVNPITLKHQSASSSASNRFIIQWAGDFVIGPGGSAIIFCDATDSRVRVF
jgi:hypothetical protein